jgi:hypothetical protein
MDGIGVSGNVSLDMNVQNVVGVHRYDELKDKPKINGVEVSGSKSLDDYGIASKADAEKAASDAAAALEHAEQTLQTNIDTEKTRAETAEQKLQNDINTKVDGIAAVMPSSSFSNTNTVKKYIDDNINSVQQSVNTLASTYQNKMLVIGDSYSDYQLSGDQKSDSSLWWYKVAMILNLTPSKYAKSGAGYVHASDGITFDTLATRAISEITDKDRYRYVFLYGGLNDIRLNVPTTDLDTALKSLLPKLRSAFPKSTIVVMGCNTFINQNINSNNDTQPTYTKRIYEIARAFNCAFIKTDTWLLGWTSQFNTAEHPNQYGEDRIAGFVLNAIYGNGYDAGIQPGSIRINSNWTLTNAKEIEYNSTIITNEMLYLSMQIKIESQPTNDAPPTINLPWNMSTGYGKVGGPTIVPITMRIGATLYNDLYAIVSSNKITIRSQNWPTIGSSTGHIYLNATLPLIFD